jgi:hypothetical protein
MSAPSPELVDLWLARAFNAQDVDAAAAMSTRTRVSCAWTRYTAPTQWRAAKLPALNPLPMRFW